MSQLTDQDKRNITKEVIFSISQYTDEDVAEDMTYADTCYVPN